MRKKILFTISSVFLALLLLLLFVFRNDKKETSVYRYSSLKSDLSVIRENRKEADLFIDEICFNELPLLYDQAEHRFYYSLMENSNDAYDPKISWNSNSVRIAFEEKEISDDLIRNNERITMILYDDQRYSENELVCTTLPLLNIQKYTDEPSFEYDDCTLTVYDNRQEEAGIAVYDGKVRIRGGSTAELAKPGLRISLDKILKGDNNTAEKMYELLGIGPDNEFILYSSNVEKDHVRNVFSSNLWFESCGSDNDLKMPLGVPYRYCEVFFNGHYWGLCALGDPIGKGRGYVELDQTSDKFLRENIYKMNFYGERERLDYELYGNDYLFFIKTNEEYAKAWQPLIDYLQLLLYSADAAALYDSVDLDNALDIYLFYNLTQAWDNAWFEDNVKFRNTYLISKVTAADKIRMYYVPWDLDRSWGHEVDDGPDYLMDYTRNFEMVMIPIENLLEMSDPKIGKLIYDKYSSLRNGEWSDDQLMSLLDRCEKDVYGSGAFLRDYDRWPQNEHDDDLNLDEFREYVLNRVHFFDEYINERFFEYNE